MILATEPTATEPAAAEVASEATAPAISPEHLKFFENKIRPLLSEKCFSCHGAENQKGSLRLDLRTSAIEVGGESGVAIIPGQPDDSLLMEAVRYESYEMPPDERLSDEQISLLEQWIQIGAPWPADSPEQAKLAARGEITDEDRSYWAFQPIRDSEIPAVNAADWPRQPVDHFVLARLEQEGLTPAAPAAPGDLIRRLFYDVIGLPPSAEQRARFEADPSYEAYVKLVDELMASPQYGEHNARQWLDLVRYAESDGYRQDAFRSQAWRYRDYVINAFNDDKPYDQFLIEQLAGDEFAPHDPNALTATAFLRHGVYEYNQRDVRTHWKEIVEEMTDVTGDVFLGLGMGCAKCHNHKFDPILQEDYYGLRAFFTPVYWEDFRPLATPKQIADYERKLAAWEAATEEIRQQIDEIEAPVLKSLAEGQINMFPEDIQEMMRKPVAERDPFEHQLAQLAWRQVLDRQKQLKTRLKGETLKKWEDLQLALDGFAKLKPAALPSGPTVRDVATDAPPTILQTRRETKEVQPHFLTVMTGQAPQIVPLPEQNSTGRRLALARWLTDPAHPLTARVMVNRIWQQHFGRGLVASPSDFGTLGEPPSHPELLDWLATRFRDNGWSMKSIHRMILLSATYRQSSRAADNPASYQKALLVDPQNELLWRMRSHRLNADQIRDAILASTGELDQKLGGPSSTPESPRRSIYTKLMRNDQHPFFTAFDAPRGTSSTSERNITTTSTQALLLMNGSWLLKRSEVLSAQVLKNVGSAPDHEVLIEQLYQQVLGRAASPEELQMADQYLKQSLYLQELAPQSEDESPLNFAQMPQRSGEAIDLTDKPDAVRPIRSGDVIDGNSPFTIEAVVFLRSLYPTSSVRTIVSQWNNNQNSPGWSFGVTSQQPRYRPGNLILQLIGDTSAGKVHYEVIPSDIHLTLNNPYFVSISVNPADQSPAGIQFYVKNLATNDPPEVANVAHSVVRNFTAPGTKIVVGGRDANVPQYWDGLIDDLRISGASLTDEELLLNQEAAHPSTVAHWQFEPLPGRLHDASPAANRLTLRQAASDHPYREPVTDIAHILLNSNELLYVD